MKSFILSLALLAIVYPGFGQTYKTKDFVKIPQGVEITKTITVKNCDEVIKAGSVITREIKKKNGKEEVTIVKVDTLKTDTKLGFDKAVPLKLSSLPGKANISASEKDGSTLLINYYLNPEHTLDSGTNIRIVYYKIDCDGKPFIEKQEARQRRLLQDTSVLLCKISNKQDTAADWFKYSDVVIEVYKNDMIDYYLINKYDRNGSYSMQLDNREYISYTKRSMEFGAITIPLKYRFGYTRDIDGNAVKVNNEFIADANLGLFAGYKLGRYRVRNDGGKLKDLSDLGATIGVFASLSSTSIDSLSTAGSGTPLKTGEKISIGVFSPGLGIMLSIYNVQIGGFIGYDFGFGANGGKWNFHKRPWLGFGVAYSLASFWKS